MFGPTGVGHDYDLSIELDCPVGECVDDEWEENADGVSNDDQATATPITGTQAWDAELCGPDEDWYAIPFESGCKLGVEVSHDTFDTSINAELLNGTSRRGSYVEGLNGTSIVYSPRTTGTVHLRVDSLKKKSYSVIVDQYDCPAHECDTDSFEPNGTFDVANPIEFGLPQMASLCEDDVDAWSIDQPDGEVCSTVINVDIAPRATVDLVDGDGVVQATFRTTSPIEYIGNDQTLLLSDGAGSEYRIRAEAECGAAPTCPDDDMFAPNWQVEQAPFIQWDVTTRLAICGSADYLHLPMVPAGCTGTVNVFTFGDNSAYGIITDEDGAAVGSMSRISRGSTDSIGETAVPRWVLVQRDSGYGGEYSISTTLECD